MNREHGSRPPLPTEVPRCFPVVGMLHYQLKDFGKRALGVVGPLESLVSRFIVGSSASVAKSWLLPLGPLQEKTRAQRLLRAATRDYPAGHQPPGGIRESSRSKSSTEL